VGAEVALATIAAGKHMVMMNVEADVTIGAYLSAKAYEAGVVYTLGAGDEPSSTMEIVNFLRGLGYPIVAAGKGKNNAFRIDATPDAYVDEATRRNMNPRMLVEFVDGSKTMVEMVALANATGLVPDVPGMHGPSAPLDALHKVFCPRDDGGLLSRRGVVDFTVARGVAPGVFAVAELRHPRLRERMNDLQLGEGPYYTFYRPYHLTSLEVPLSAAAAVLYQQSHMRPLATPVAEVGARAKRDLAPGETLDAIGEYCYRGFALARADALAQNALPLGLAQGATVTRRIAAGEYLTYANCAADERLQIVQVRRAQDDHLRLAAAA
jgi:predicted homoserine dehydrogenase-like protein